MNSRDQSAAQFYKICGHTCPEVEKGGSGSPLKRRSGKGFIPLAKEATKQARMRLVELKLLVNDQPRSERKRKTQAQLLDENSVIEPGLKRQRISRSNLNK